MAKKTEKKAAPRKSGAPRAAAGSSKAPAGIYTIMLFVSALALFLGCIFLFLEMKTYDMIIKVPANLQGSWQAPGVSNPADAHQV